MPKHLLIVESPAKAKTIEKYLGKDFTVKSSYGHITDLAKDSKEVKAIEVAQGYKTNYVISEDKVKVVRELKDWVQRVDDVWLATDEDREGEAISWHLAQVLDLDVATTKRIVFREITKAALQKAIQQPRVIDLNLVNAQQARRVIDRLVGFELSELLWKKVKGKLSAGRVQSVAVRLIVDREREIATFIPHAHFKVAGHFTAPNLQGIATGFKAELNRDFEQVAQAEEFLNRCIPASYKVTDVQVKPATRKPAAPFTTSTLQQEASRKLGFSVSRTMTTAQKLYEAGHITYMRTDAVNLSEDALKSIAKQVEAEYGKRYVQTRRYKNKNENAQEAHEAIRPTAIERQEISAERDEARLYELIWKRTIASQMAEAELERTVVDIAISTVKEAKLVATGEVLKFDGFLKVYLEDTDDEEEKEDKDSLLPPLKVGQELALKMLVATERFTRPAPRYTEASLVKKLEELGIGRPSTYAPTISKIMEPSRGYVTKESREGHTRVYRVLVLDGEKARKNHPKPIAQAEKTEITGAEKNKLFAKDMGMIVTDFLTEHFDQIMDYHFTADIEDQLDDVAAGREDWVGVVDGIYRPFHSLVEMTEAGADRATGERFLGKDPVTGMSVIARMGRYGPVVQIGTQEEIGEGGKPQYANLKQGMSLENLTFEEAQLLFELPKKIGMLEGHEVIISEGRYGPYIKFDNKFISLPKDEDPRQLSYERALQLIAEKREAERPFAFFQDKPVTKGNGRFGPFVKWNEVFVSIPKSSGYTLETIDPAGAVRLIEQKLQKEANKVIQRWEEEGISLENGRYGPEIVLGKKSYRLPAKPDGTKHNAESAANLTLAEVQALVLAQGGKLKTEEETKPKPAAKKPTAKAPAAKGKSTSAKTKAAPPKAKAAPKTKPKS